MNTRAHVYPGTRTHYTTGTGGATPLTAVARASTLTLPNARNSRMLDTAVPVRAATRLPRSCRERDSSRRKRVSTRVTTALHQALCAVHPGGTHSDSQRLACDDGSDRAARPRGAVKPLEAQQQGVGLQCFRLLEHLKLQFTRATCHMRGGRAGRRGGGGITWSPLVCVAPAGSTQPHLYAELCRVREVPAAVTHAQSVQKQGPQGAASLRGRHSKKRVSSATAYAPTRSHTGRRDLAKHVPSAARADAEQFCLQARTRAHAFPWLAAGARR